MTIRVIESDGSVKTTVPLADIDHVETRTLSYFGESTHNLYLHLGDEHGGYFLLFTYSCPINMDRAERDLKDLVDRKKSGETITDQDVLELFPYAAPVDGLTIQGIC